MVVLDTEPNSPTPAELAYKDLVSRGYHQGGLWNGPFDDGEWYMRQVRRGDFWTFPSLTQQYIITQAAITSTRSGDPYARFRALNQLLLQEYGSTGTRYRVLPRIAALQRKWFRAPTLRRDPVIRDWSAFEGPPEEFKKETLFLVVYHQTMPLVSDDPGPARREPRSWFSVGSPVDVPTNVDWPGQMSVEPVENLIFHLMHNNPRFDPQGQDRDSMRAELLAFDEKLRTDPSMASVQQRCTEAAEGLLRRGMYYETPFPPMPDFQSLLYRTHYNNSPVEGWRSWLEMRPSSAHPRSDSPLPSPSPSPAPHR